MDYVLESPFRGAVGEIPCVPLADYILGKVDSALKNKPDAAWMTDVSTGESMLLSQVEQLSRNVASALAKKSFQSQEVVVFITNNACNIYAIYLGIWRLNGIIRPCISRETSRILENFVRDSKSRFIICDRGNAGTVRTVLRKIEWKIHVYCFDKVERFAPVDELLRDDGSAFPSGLSVNPDVDLAAIACTGGTTGISKGAVFTHRALVSMLFMDKWFTPRCQNNRILATFKSFHANGMFSPFGTMCGGFQQLLLSDLTVEKFIRAIKLHKPFCVMGFPTALATIAQNPLMKEIDTNSVTTVMTFGSIINSYQREAIGRGLPNVKVFHVGYGSTETQYISCTIDPSVELCRDEDTPRYKDTPKDSVGYLLPYVKVKIYDKNSGKFVGPNTTGEICVQTPALFKNYHNSVEASIVDGWHHTGDNGYFDENNFLYCQGRSKDMFKHATNHVSPLELENIIMEIPDIVEAAVIGIPDPETEFIPKAFVVRKEDSAVDADYIKNYVKDRVADHKQLRGGVQFLRGIPKTNVSKISRPKLQKLYAEGRL